MMLMQRLKCKLEMMLVRNQKQVPEVRFVLQLKNQLEVIPDVVKFPPQMMPMHVSKLKVKMARKRKKSQKTRTTEEWKLEEEEGAEVIHKEEEAEEEEQQ